MFKIYLLHLLLELTNNNNLSKVYSSIQLEKVLNYLVLIGVIIIIIIIIINKENIEQFVLKNEFNWPTFLKYILFIKAIIQL